MCNEHRSLRALTVNSELFRTLIYALCLSMRPFITATLF